MAGRHRPSGKYGTVQWKAGGTPQHTEPAAYGLDMGDEGMVGHHQADEVTLRNAHPHQSHSVGYEDSTLGTVYENHGFAAVHFKHGNRGKGAEHHPPAGLFEPNAVDHTKKTQKVF